MGIEWKGQAFVMQVSLTSMQPGKKIWEMNSSCLSLKSFCSSNPPHTTKPWPSLTLAMLSHTSRAVQDRHTFGLEDSGQEMWRSAPWGLREFTVCRIRAEAQVLSYVLSWSFRSQDPSEVRVLGRNTLVLVRGWYCSIMPSSLLPGTFLISRALCLEHSLSLSLKSFRPHFKNSPLRQPCLSSKSRLDLTYYFHGIQFFSFLAFITINNNEIIITNCVFMSLTFFSQECKLLSSITEWSVLGTQLVPRKYSLTTFRPWFSLLLISGCWCLPHKYYCECRERMGARCLTYSRWSRSAIIIIHSEANEN